jgi:hypothetical protein
MMKTLWTILIAGWLGLALTTARADDPPAPDEDPQPAAEQAADQDSAGEQLSHAQERELLQVIRRRFPHRYEQLTELRENNADRYHQVMARWYRRYEQWQAMGPEIQRLEMTRQELEIQSTQLVQRWRQAPDDDAKQQIEAELRQVLTKRFDIEHELHAKRLEQMAQQLEQLRQEHAERGERRSEIIQQELNSLLRGIVSRPDPERPEDDPPRGPHGRGPGRPEPDPPADEQAEDDSQAQD